MSAKGKAKVVLSNMQIFMIVIASTTAFGHFVYVHLAILFAGRDAWISLIIACLAGLVIQYLQLTLAIGKSESLVEHAVSVFGKWIGGFVSVIYIVFFLIIVAFTIKIVSDFMGVIYPTTPPGVFLLAEFTVGAWAVYSGIEVIGRTMQVLLPLMMLLGITASLLSTPDKDFTQLYPIFNQGITPVTQGALAFIAMLSELIGFGMIAEHARKPEKLARQSSVLVFVLLIMFLSPVTGPVMVFGETLAKDLSFPTYTEIQYIHVTNIIERLDIVGVLLWTIGSFFRIAMFMFAAVKGVSQLVGAKKETTFLIPVTLLCAAFSLSLMQSSREEIYHFLGSGYLYVAPAIGVGLPLLTGAVAWAKKAIGNRQAKLRNAG
ncbi:GerAB/ArcD/ProY family transporter [Alicyclobacillus fastidiosus]|uniref:Endospore germination permease n=1 Tax=Alicyclobacillus fastidiosus TaxID=392011 RepID=A0ABV5AC61_9BACL|nr:endospore germination permease [Alicyclobacillus fastidiosus]WEH11443.1 endospore germination permease [Alicyclobacillus fastidiosus]